MCTTKSIYKALHAAVRSTILTVLFLELYYINQGLCINNEGLPIIPPCLFHQGPFCSMHLRNFVEWHQILLESKLLGVQILTFLDTFPNQISCSSGNNPHYHWSLPLLSIFYFSSNAVCHIKCLRHPPLICIKNNRLKYLHHPHFHTFIRLLQKTDETSISIIRLLASFNIIKFLKLCKFRAIHWAKLMCECVLRLFNACI